MTFTESPAGGGPTAETIARPLVEVRGLSKSYGNQQILREMNLGVARGEVHGIIGPSGSGKSTMLRCINGLETYQGGSIRVDGELLHYRTEGDKLVEVGARELAKRRAKTGMVFQGLNLFANMSAVANIMEAPVRVRGKSKAEARIRALQLLDRVGLSHRVDAYPHEMSLGQQQRVAIARALAMDPILLLFDEPTSALDPELVGEVLQVMRDLAADRVTTMMIVTHEIAFAREVCDVISFVDGGQILESGPPAQILGAPAHDRTAQFLSRVLQP